MICDKCQTKIVPVAAYRCGECRRRYLREWVQKNREKHNANGRAWAAKNPEKRRAIVRASDQKHKEKRAAYHRVYQIVNKHRLPKASYDVRIAAKNRLRAKKAGVLHASYKPTEILKLNDGLCAWCDSPAKEIDHFIPISRGGHDVPDNVVPCCGPCNRSKNYRLPEEWFGVALNA